jgi:hypothetical protein
VSERARLAALWRAALAMFAIAAAAGAVFRGRLAWGWDLGIALANLRHAHSHLMFFGWVTPAAMILIAARLPALTGRASPRALAPIVGATIALGLASFPVFAAFGYTKVAILGAELPPSVIVAGLNMLAWYAFVLVYARASRGVRRGAALFAWDLALALLVVSSLSAWALALVRPLGLDAARIAPLLTRAFLDTFSEGWLPLAVIGALHAERPRAHSRRLAMIALALSAPLAFGIAVPSALVPPSLRWASMGAGVVWSVSLLAQLTLFAREARDPRLGVPLALGALAAIGRGLASLAPDWPPLQGMTLLYLHLLLLGMVSLAWVGLARGAIGDRSAWPIQLASLAVIASLVPLSSAWPPAWSSAAFAELAAWIAWAPVVAAVLAVIGPRGARPPWRARERSPSSGREHNALA